LNTEDNFNLFVPVTFSKAKQDSSGKKVRKFGGVASTDTKDADDEILEPNGFDLSIFLQEGFFNWAHMSGDPLLAAIGYPTKAEVKDNILYVEGELYDSPLADKVYQLQEILEKSNSGRSLHFSIEGKATKRKSTDKKDSGYKHIEEADIHHCAICLIGKNPGTKMTLLKSTSPDIIKSFINGGDVEAILDLEVSGERIVVDKELNIIKAITTTSDTSGVAIETNPVMKESLEGASKLQHLKKKKDKNKNFSKKFSKSFIFDKIFNYIYDINKSEKIVVLIEAIEKQKEDKMDNNNTDIVSNESIIKAFDMIGLNYEEVFSKGEKPASDADPKKDEDVVKSENAEEGDKDSDKKDKDKKKKKDGEEDEDKDDAPKTDDVKKSEDGATEPATPAPPAVEVISKSEAADLFKSLTEESNKKTDDLIKSFGIITKTIIEKFEGVNNDLSKSLSEVTKQLSEVSGRMEEYEKEPVRKAITGANYIEKSFNNETPSNVRTLSIVGNKRELMNIITGKVNYDAIQKGHSNSENDFWAKEAATYEVTPGTLGLSPEAILKLKQENILITK